MSDGPLLVTGGSGFIGSTLIRHLVGSATVLNVDAHTYAADDRRLPNASTLTTIDLDITDPGFRKLVRERRPSAIVHLAAETHVTRSETDQERFFSTNIDGTRNVLEAARGVGVERVLHVSTDEVYGPALDGPFTEDEKEPGEGKATSAYARSKAIADDIAWGYARSMAVVILRPTNCFGPWQHPEKAFARWVTRALLGERVPVWGDGLYVRDWMYVDDLCKAILRILELAPHSGTYNIAPARDGLPNVEIARRIAVAAGASPDVVYLTDYDRPQHDRVYAVDTERIRSKGWTPSVTLDAGIRQTVDWYERNRDWWEPLLSTSEMLYGDAKARSDR